MTKKFTDLGLSRPVLAAVRTLGYTEPTPVQEKAIPYVLEGRDVVAAARTGTGKTAAFALPTMDGLGHARHGQGPLMLVVTPTRELADQITGVCQTVAEHTHHVVECVVGGVGYQPQIKALSAGCDVLVATPGRLIDLMGQDAVSLGQVGKLVLDEADRMLDMGFLPDVRRIVAACKKDRQTMLFSATLDESIERNLAHLLHDPAYVEVAHRGETAENVEQFKVDVDQRAKFDLLIALLRDKGAHRVIVFARTRHRVENCCRKLRRAGFKAAQIHSDRTQSQRRHALAAFESGEVDVLVGTDVLARGIDVPDVSYVVNLDMPVQAEDYVHRIGRTGRAGETGFAVSFVTPETRGLLKDVEKLTHATPKDMVVKGFDPSASEERIAAKATRKAASHDPELAEAVAEEKARQKKRQRKGQQHKRGAQQSHGRKPRRERDERDDRGQRANKKRRSGSRGDMRPGRHQRARRDREHRSMR